MPRFFWLVAALMLSGCGTEAPPAAMEPVPREFVLVANRGSASLSVIDVETDLVVETVPLPGGALPTDVGYVAFSALHERVYVGDDANKRIIVMRAADFTHVVDLAMPSDVFHMWLDDTQLWAVDRDDKSVVAFDLATNARLTVAPIPADLEALGGKPHDVVVDGNHAFVTVLAVNAAPDVVVKYSKTTFTEVDRAPVGEDPHVFLHPSDRRLYVACQDTDNVFVLNRDTMAQLGVVPIFGGHGVWIPAHGQTLYVSNFPSHVIGGQPGPGATGLFAVELGTDTAIGGLPTPFSSPHNITSTRDGSKLYVTHSNGAGKVTVYDVAGPASIPVLARDIDVGTTPFGIAQFLR